MVLTMSAVAEHKQIKVAKLEVHVEPRVEEDHGEMRSHFVSRVDLGPGLDKRERTILFNAARRCEVHKLLSGPISFDFTLAEEAGAA